MTKSKMSAVCIICNTKGSCGILFQPGAGRDTSLAFNVAFAPLNCVQLGTRKFNVDDFPVPFENVKVIRR